jgi:hypothetical protein
VHTGFRQLAPRRRVCALSSAEHIHVLRVSPLSMGDVTKSVVRAIVPWVTGFERSTKPVAAGLGQLCQCAAPMHRRRAIAVALPPLVKAARARFNLKEYPRAAYSSSPHATFAPRASIREVSA